MTEEEREIVILIAEDEPAMRDVLNQTLLTILPNSRCYKIILAKNGREALAMIDPEFPPDFIITDMNMPGINGMELSRRVKKEFPTLPILLLTADPQQLQKDPQSANVFDKIMSKPYKLDELGETVNALLFRT